MPEYTYLDFEREADDNQAVGSALVTRFPEGWAGNRVNNSAAAMASSIRTLGDRTLFAPVDGDGNPVSQQAGTLALQDADDVTFTGGVIDGLRGAVPIGTVIFYGKSFDTYAASYTTLLTQGWVICDGRAVVNPMTGATVTLPNFVGRYPFGASTDALTVAGTFSHVSSEDGLHAHAGGTAVAGLHTHVGSSVGGSGGGAGIGAALINIPSDGNHQHGIANDGSHTHTVFVQPPSIYLIPLMRVW